MFDADKMTKEFIMIVGSGLLGYAQMIKYKPNDTYIPPTKEDVIREYQNTPLFNRTVDTIVSHLQHVLQQNAEPDLEKMGYCPKCGVRPCDCKNLFGEEKTGLISEF